MPGPLFHAEAARRYFKSKGYDSQTISDNIIYALMPDIVWGAIDNMNYKISHNPITDSAKLYCSSGVPIMMMKHHLMLDYIADNNQSGILNGHANLLHKRFSRFKIPKFISEIVMDMALDLAQYENKNDITLTLNRSSETIDPEKISSCLSSIYRFPPKDFRVLCSEMKRFDYTRINSIDGMAKVISEFFLKKPATSKYRSICKVKNWIGKKKIDIIKRTLLGSNCKDDIYKLKDYFSSRLDEIHTIFHNKISESHHEDY